MGPDQIRPNFPQGPTQRRLGAMGVQRIEAGREPRNLDMTELFGKAEPPPIQIRNDRQIRPRAQDLG